MNRVSVLLVGDSAIFLGAAGHSRVAADVHASRTNTASTQAAQTLAAGAQFDHEAVSSQSAGDA